MTEYAYDRGKRGRRRSYFDFYEKNEEKTPERRGGKRKTAVALVVLLTLAALIGQGIPIPAPKTGAIDQIYTAVANPVFYRFFVKADPFRVTDACVSCGKCAAACPLGNITMVAGKPRWGGDCTHCMACICGCPVEAIEYGRKSRGKPRYQCPHYRSEE